VSLDFYLASRYARRPELQVYAEELRERGHRVPARWLAPGGHASTGPGAANDATFANDDLEDIMSSDVFVHFTEGPMKFRVGGWKPQEKSFGGCDIWSAGTSGRQREHGFVLGLRYAMAPSPRLVIVGPWENIFDSVETNDQFTTWNEFLDALDRLEPTRRATPHPWARRVYPFRWPR
jgi:hypothetical protein